MCAVGCLIPDTKYTYEIEGSTIEHTNEALSKLLTQLGLDPHLSLLNDLQLAHDELLSSVGSTMNHQFKDKLC